ncbi:glycosyltransferase family 20-domain-containing protein [Jimgerdemannia flammicorona]|uniref:Glycosyltransferase family 20-domain-containing protein n=1 Tax=Jimgerdemannia flammicorona TaxID=994334 RepID=A0A432ZZ44_9FUNG|nr:glycosyltransferase family 20-domain-containing protein [Jimgerdemannia flammicorona]
MPALTKQRVVVASLFLPHTVDFHVSKEKTFKFTKPAVEPNPAAPIPNLIETLAAQQKEQNPNKRTSLAIREPTLFDGQQQVPHLTQPRSRARAEEESKKLPPLGVSHLPREKRSSQDNAEVFAEAPWTVETGTSGNIGLHNAVRAVSGKLSTQVWVGTLGMPTDALTDKTRADIESKFIIDYNSFPVIVPDTEFEGHYSQYCKQVLWPTFHYVVPDDSKNKVYQDGAWKHYKSLNERFAATIVQHYQPDDISKSNIAITIRL